MIQSKKKHCDGCSQPKYIWKNRGGKKYCKTCWSCHEGNVKLKPIAKQKRISPRSEKRIIADKKYSKLRKVFLEEKPTCEAQLIGCAGASCQVHHTYSGKDRSEYYLDVSTWISICDSCHKWIHQYSKEARELGLLK